MAINLTNNKRTGHVGSDRFGRGYGEHDRIGVETITG